MAGNRLTHLDSSSAARMVDVSDKPPVPREALAEGFITLGAATVRAIVAGAVPKGEVLAVARVAGIMAAKRCGELVPLCHPLPVDAVRVEFDVPRVGAARRGRVRLGIRATARIVARTGVEMEALTAVAVAALTVYDMCKAIDRGMSIGGIRLVSKTKG